jgi:collagenase-like PrtC family protease
LITKNFSISTKDLCLAKQLPAIIKSDIHSIKIEGRMKSENYLATVVHAYRQALDSSNKQQKLVDVSKQLNAVANRPTSHG